MISVTLGRHRADGITIRVGNLRMPGAAGWLCRKLDQSAAMLRSVAEDWLPSRKLAANERWHRGQRLASFLRAIPARDDLTSHVGLCYKSGRAIIF